MGIRAKFARDVTIRSDGLLFNCGRIMENCTVACSAFEKNIFKGVILSDGIFIDVGAHIGKHSLHIAKQYPAINVISIEASPDTFKLLKENIELNAFRTVKAFNFVCSDKVGKTVFWKSEYHPPTNSCLKIRGAQKLILPTNTLDNTIKEKSKVSAIKIDVEGAELHVLRGAKKIIAQSKPQIIFEAWNRKKLTQIRNELIPYGYKIRRIDKENYISFIP